MIPQNAGNFAPRGAPAAGLFLCRKTRGNASDKFCTIW